jgi:hypothetical protein
MSNSTHISMPKRSVQDGCSVKGPQNDLQNPQSFLHFLTTVGVFRKTTV